VLQEPQFHLPVLQAHAAHLDPITQWQGREDARLTLVVEDRHEVEEHPAPSRVALKDDDGVR